MIEHLAIIIPAATIVVSLVVWLAHLHFNITIHGKKLDELDVVKQCHIEVKVLLAEMKNEMKHLKDSLEDLKHG